MKYFSKNYFEKEFFIMGFFGLFNKKVNEGNTDITAPVPKTGIDSPAEYLAVVMLYCDNFEEVLQDVEQISLEAYRGFGREMHDAIDMATWKHNFGCEIYFRDFKDPENPPKLDGLCSTIHKRVEISSELISEGLDILETANKTEDSPLFESGVKKIQEGMRLGVSVAQGRNDLEKEIFHL